MATRAANPYYDDPYLAGIASNITKAFVDPHPGQSEAYRQHARLYGLQADEIQNKQRFRASAAGRFRTAGGRVLTPEEVAQLTGDTIEGGLKPGDTAESNLFYVANAGAPDSSVARAFVGTGKAIGEKQGFSTADRDAIAKRDADEAARRTGITAGATVQAAREHEAGADRRHSQDLEWKKTTRWDKPDNVPEGNAVFYAPGDPRFQGVQPGSIPAPRMDKERFVQSEDPNNPGKSIWRKVEDGIAGPPAKPGAEHFVQSEDPNNPGKNIYLPPKAGLPGPATKPGTPSDISPDEVAKLERSALADVGAADPATWNVDPAFSEAYAAKLPAARQAAAAEYQRTRNAAAGQAAYLSALGIQPGSIWNKTGSISRLFGGKGGGSFNAPAGAAPAAPAGPSDGSSNVPSLPPEAAARVKEGAITTFGNGQSWTRQNGALVRVK